MRNRDETSIHVMMTGVFSVVLENLANPNEVSMLSVYPSLVANLTKRHSLFTANGRNDLDL